MAHFLTAALYWFFGLVKGVPAKGFRLFWKWKSQAGQRRLPENIRKLVVQMAQGNPTWGQARVAAELSVKLGIHVSPRTERAS